jgi:hypothetical protein
MLTTIDGKQITTVPHGAQFAAIERKLGSQRAEEVRADLHRIVDEIKPVDGKRTFSSSHLGSDLTPWQPPLQHLYDVSREMLGAAADEADVQQEAALAFGLFIWECIMTRDEEWAFYDPNLSAVDPNREVTGKVYFER